MLANGKPISYTIELNDEQRLALIDVLRRSKHDEEALELWVDMLSGLYDQELDHPNTIHGFCY